MVGELWGALDLTLEALSTPSRNCTPSPKLATLAVHCSLSSAIAATRAAMVSSCSYSSGLALYATCSRIVLGLRLP